MAKKRREPSDDDTLNLPLNSRAKHEEVNDGFHQDYPSTEPEPYQIITHLSHGASGSVHEVTSKSDSSRKVYAQKQVILVGPRPQRLDILNKLKEEARIIQRLRHRHIVEVAGTYTWSNRFSILLSTVADTDLRKLLEEVDGIPNGQRRDEARDKLMSWAGCLIRALDYLHEMRVKHRDIKPSNILVKHNTVYLADFGTSKIIPHEHTTGTTGDYGAITIRYAAPEALQQDDARRGRATDIYSMGCVLLEIATALIAPPGSHERFIQFRQESSGSTAFAANLSSILQWIWHLWAYGSLASSQDTCSTCAAILPDLAFLILDPDPSQRITTRQILALLQDPSLYYLSVINAMCCVDCRVVGGLDHNIPRHSVFKDEQQYPRTTAEALKVSVAPDWEAAKVKWLKSHMWWPN
jgi:serine/threonine protein kinase